MKALDRAVALASLFILSSLAVIPADWSPWIQVPLALSALGAAIASFKHGGRSGGEVALIVAGLGLAMVAGMLWQVAMPLALLAYGFVAKQCLALDVRNRWRGVFQMSLRALFGSYAASVMQRLSFGVQHANGFPRGIVGVCLAFLWGLLQGLLRDRSGGLLAPIIAHIVADASIAIIALVLLMRS